MSELPTGWISATINDVAHYVQRGKSPKYTEHSKLPVINQKCIRWHGIDEAHLKYVDPKQWHAWGEERFLRAGDILWNSTGTGTIGRASLYTGLKTSPQAVVDLHVTIVRPNGAVLGQYLHRLIHSPSVQSKIDEMQSGSTNQVELGRSEVLKTHVPLPPLPEQHRIVAKIDSLSAKSKRARDQLDHILRLVEKYKQAILAAAFQGKLLSEQTEQKTLGEVCQIKSGFAFKSSDFRTMGDVPVVRIGDIIDGEVRFTDTSRYLDQRFLATASDFCVERGDILVALSGATTGKSGIYGLERPALLNKRVARLRVQEPTDRQFIAYFVEWISDEILGASYGGAQPNISPQLLAAFALEWPSVNGRAEVVRKVQAAFAWIGRLASETTNARKLIDHLDQAVLAKAFRGELVPQDPNDEPASVLLERIRAERAAAPGKPSARRLSQTSNRRVRMSSRKRKMKR